jgi:hypothetical protein
MGSVGFRRANHTFISSEVKTQILFDKYDSIELYFGGHVTALRALRLLHSVVKS